MAGGSEQAQSGTPAAQPMANASAVTDLRGCPPPAYHDVGATGGGEQTAAGATAAGASAAAVGCDAFMVELPPYEAAAMPTKLPSYEESEKSKQQEAAGGAGSSASFFTWRPSQIFFGRRSASGDEEMVGPDGSTIGGQRLSHAQLSRLVVGTDIDFFCCFLIAFVFNWVGLVCTLCCLTVTIAGRAGAMAGFGLSVVKWALLVMHQSRFAQQKLGLLPSDLADEDHALDVNLEDNHYFVASCWLIVVLGFLCFLQGVVHYFKAKRCARDYQWLRNRYWGLPAAAVY